MRITAFSFLATSRLSSVRCRPRVYVSVPRTVRPLATEFVWMEMKRSALALLAICARLSNPTNTSDFRVYTIFTSGQLAWMSFPNFRATFRLMVFSLPRLPMAPGSRPPCPGSITTVKSLPSALTLTKGRADHRQHRRMIM